MEEVNFWNIKEVNLIFEKESELLRLIQYGATVYTGRLTGLIMGVVNFNGPTVNI